ncbi:MAG: DNA mismatch repair endonuclease MutL [Puniceicoccales bacterium]|jgi:DNA mismatch repair protein MutL|nr:DNA mismatch repair endonuclease MutL [Puniceicoccales bacterium]
MFRRKIAILSDNVINKIAAGEIIERPAAVVKELVENSLDAGAKNIGVRFSRGGKFSIIVEDDGCGMAREEALLAMERHATSKLRDVQDLNSLCTFGFRGEAIPSIASISNFKLLTCCELDECGTEIIMRGGKDMEVKNCPRFRGTKIIVDNLFCNVPARRKFLKSDETEGGHIISLLKNLALAEIGVKISLFQNGNEIFHSPQSDKLGERVNEIFKHNEKFIDFSYKTDLASIKGTVCDPTSGNICKKNIVSFVNGRLVKSNAITLSLSEELSTIFPAHRGILMYIFLAVDPQSIDVNVHPMKKEVRFKSEMAIGTLIRNCMIDVFESRKAPLAIANSVIARPKFPAEESHVHRKSFAGHGVSAALGLPPRDASLRHEIPFPETLFAAQKDFIPDFRTGDCLWKFIGFISDEIALFEGKTGVIVFSIKLAASRTIYEKIMASDSTSNCSQQLLMPVEFSMTPEESESIQHFFPVFSKHGFSIYSFGHCDYKIDAIPGWFSYKDTEVVIWELVSSGQDLSNHSTFFDIEKMFAKCLSKAVNTSEYKTQGGIESLRDKLLNCANPLLCPSGNATYFEIPFCEINNRFHGRKT